ncbi:hypothetical protein FBALC1_12972 [Flavobacteriales bacterium ALC-1]|nr:hypothetical protein FBALC1_12972 [Flavobacteriales bacterium ALC-1]
MKYLFTIIPLLFSSLVLAQDVNMQTTTVNQCGGVFYDSGGEFGNYGNDENFVLTICPENAGQKIQLDFTTFVTQLGATPDVMSIFNGDSVAAPPFGDFSGTTSPGLVQATQDNTSGCITIQFVSSDGGNIDGWAANISCLTPCQTINSQIDSTSPAPNGDGYIRVCPNEEVTLTGSGVFSIDGTGATYEWDLGDGNTASGQTATFSYPDPGVYIVNLNIRDANTSIDPLGCENNNLVNQVIQVATEPDFTGTEAVNATICYGESTDITGSVVPVEFINDCTPPVSGVTFLPDGNGVSYETSITVDCYDSAQTITDVNQLVSICLTMEHSYLGDLDIEIISPNGQVVRMHDQGGNSANLGIPWASDTVDAFGNGNTPGVGLQYCFVPSGGFPTLVGGIQTGGVFTINDGPGTYNDSFVPAGNYSSVNPLDGLIGSPLNGDWTIRVVDNLGSDNGHIFAWSIEFDPALQPPELSFTPVITSEAWDTDPTITNTIGNVITVTPPDAGQHCYTYRVTDDFGCEYTEEVCIDVLPELITETPNNLFVCDSGAPPYIFDLDSNTAIVLASATNASDLVVTYHNSLADADADIGAIAGSGSYTGTDGETIFVRVEYLDSGCYEVQSFTLNVIGQPTINTVSDIELCDDASNDGFAEFDLSSQDLGILGTQSSTDFAVSYHLSFADADSGTGALPNLYTNVNNPEPIYVRVESVGDSNCYNASATPLFNLVVNTAAVANPVMDMVVCDDISNDGIATFDLSNQEPVILGAQNPGVFTVTFHGSQADADANISPLPTNYTNIIPNLETIYARVEDPLEPSCYDTTSFDLVVNGLPVLSSVTPLQVCDDDADGFVGFPLSTKTSEILNGQTGVEVSYHESLVGAETDTAEVLDGYVNTTMTSQTIYVRMENTATTCYNITVLQLEVLENPIANATTPLEVCDDDTDGIATFDLSTKDAQIIGSQTGMSVSYYSTPELAETGTSAVATIYTTVTREIYARIENGTTGCYATTTLQLIVNPLPTIIAVTPYELCDYNNPGDEQEQFDLTTKDAEILNGQVNISIAYYASQTDADMGINAIIGLYSNTSNSQSIIAVLTNTMTGCNSSVTFDLVVNPLPVLVAPTALEVCDDGTPDGLTEMDLSLKNTEITGNNPNYSVSYYQSQVDADSELNPLPTLYTNTSNGQIIYVRVEDINTGCYDTTTLELIVEQAPIAFTPTPLRYCDPDNDGIGVFSLTDADNEITGGAPGLTVSYHETLVNAENDADAIDTTIDYTNIVLNAQTLYARVESATIATDCATIVALDLIVEPTPQLVDPTPLEACDDISADGFANFDLTSKNEEVLNGQDPMQYQVSYYETQANALSASNAIVGPSGYTNTSAFNQILWVRVEDITTVSGCYKLTTLELIVNPLPVLVAPSPLELCDVNNPGDGQEGFNLEDANAEILNGQGGVSLTYYETQLDADNATNPIESPYVNTSNAQTIFVRAENNTTGCYSTVTLTLRVDPIPTPTASDQLPDLELCDQVNTGDGVEVFDLTEREVLILNGESGVTATYHETLADADSGSNPIADPTQYTNIESPSQEIYVRVTNDVTGCYTLVDFTITVYPLPDVVAVTDFIQCELNTDGFDSFDLTSKDDEVLNGQDPSQFIVSYHASVADAEAGVNGLVSSYTNQSNPQQIFVRITNNVTGCSISTQSFNIQVDEAAEANSDMNAILYETCDDTMETDGDPTNDSTQFDLTTQDDQVLDGQDPANYIVTYYATEADANLNVNPLPSLYENIVNPQTIYARVDNNTLDAITGADTSICYAVAGLTLQVNPLPEFDLDDSYILCVTTNGTEILDPLVLDTGLSETAYSFEWSYNGAILATETGSSLMPTGGGTYSVTVTDISSSTVTSCVNTDTTEVIESAPPSLEVNLVTQAFADNNVIEALATGIGVYEYSLDGGPWQDSGTFTNVSSGTHEVTARDKNGCGMVSTSIFVIDYPAYFTPNGDGNHDTWNIPGIGSSAKIYIFDRYGKLLKQISPTGSGWNGTYRGNLMPTSDYWFTVEYDEPLTGNRKEFKAHFTLKR